MLPRKIFEKLKKQKTDKKISFLLGARQVGKTTILKQLNNEFEKTNKCLFLDLDILTNYEKASTYDLLLNTLRLNGYSDTQKEFFYLFLDEFQRYADISKVMKNVYDNTNNIKIYASGSSSLAIKDNIQESLAGRKIINEVHPLDFEEFLWFKQDNNLIEKFSNAKRLSGENLFKVLKELSGPIEEFIIFGGYPELVLRSNKEEKISILESIFDLYVKKDLVDYLKVERILNVKKLIEFLAVNNGRKIKFEELTAATSMRYQEVKQYLEVLKETYLIYPLTPFFTNKNKEIVKIPKIYFVDNGVRNFFIKNFNKTALRDDAGFLFEGTVIGELLKNNMKNLKFWQDKNKNEVDIIIDKGQIQTPIEVKYKQKLKSEDFRGINTFLENYPSSKNAFLINLGVQKNIKKINALLFFSLKRIYDKSDL